MLVLVEVCGGGGGVFVLSVGALMFVGLLLVLWRYDSASGVISFCVHTCVTAVVGAGGVNLKNLSAVSAVVGARVVD